MVTSLATFANEPEVEQDLTPDLLNSPSATQPLNTDSAIAQTGLENLEVDDKTSSPLITAEVSQSEKSLTIERIYSAPSLNGQQPKSIKFSPDGTRVTYLQSNKDNINRYDLWEYHIATKQNQLLVDSLTLFDTKEALSDEEKSRRERQRIYGVGIMEYQFSPDGKLLLFPVNGEVYTYQLDTKALSRLTNTTAFETDIKFSPKGNYLSYIREQNIFIQLLKTGKELQLTSDGGGAIKNGMSEFVAQEEMNRMTGYWWSPNEEYIAFIRVDESPVETITRNEIYAEHIKTIEQRYPATGTNNAILKLAITDIKGKKIRYIDTGDNTDIYIPRVMWQVDSKSFSYQRQSRDQKTLSLKTYNIKKRRQKNLLTEKSDHWVNLHKDLLFLNDNKRFIWSSERDGFKHLYLYTIKGELITQLTKGSWVVDAIKHVDEQNGWVYFTGRADTPLERHLYRVTLSGKSPDNVQRISLRSGFHHIEFNQQRTQYVDTFSSLTTPTQVSLHTIQGQHINWISENKISDTHPLAPYYENIVIPQLGSIKASDGETELFYKLFKPNNMLPGKKYPAIVKVYGGPLAQSVTNQWQGAALTQYLVQQGFIVFQLDNRGTTNRGSSFEQAIYKQLAKVEISDQITGAKFLQNQPFIDENNIGIYGHSYGGYLTLMAMFKANEYFKAAVSGAPVTDWLLYDTHYTERYLSHPKSNQEGYQQSNAIEYISGLKGALMIYHGMADDNVLFTHTTKMTKALQDQGKLFELMTYPGSKHSMRGEKVKIHLNKSIADFFDRHLKH